MGFESAPISNEESIEHRGFRKGLYLLPAAFTTANVLMGFLAVIYSLRGFQLLATDANASGWYFDLAAKLIGFSILFDMLDGRVARMTKTTTELGIQLDSLADVLAFGIAPIVLVYCWAIGAVFPEDSEVYGLGLFVLFMYLMGGTFRLARFNIQSMRPRVIASGTPKFDKKNFVGLPIPPAAGLIAAMVHFKPRPLSVYDPGVAAFWVIVMMFVLAALALLMVSKFRYTSFKSIGTGRLNLYLILLIGGIGMSIWLYSRYVLLSIAISYVTHGVIWFVLNLFRSSRKEIVEQELLEEQTAD